MLTKNISLKLKFQFMILRKDIVIDILEFAQNWSSLSFSMIINNDFIIDVI